jgi:transposase
MLYAEGTIESIPVRKTPRRLIGDTAYYSQVWREVFRRRFKTDLIAPPKSNYRDPICDRRKLRRLKKRYKVERLNAWLKNFKRLRTRWEVYLANYQGFLTLGCLEIYLRHL